MSSLNFMLYAPPVLSWVSHGGLSLQKTLENALDDQRQALQIQDTKVCAHPHCLACPRGEQIERCLVTASKARP